MLEPGLPSVSSFAFRITAVMRRLRGCIAGSLLHFDLFCHGLLDSGANPL
jgi:hypothetical protein